MVSMPAVASMPGMISVPAMCSVTFGLMRIKRGVIGRTHAISVVSLAVFCSMVVRLIAVMLVLMVAHVL